MNGLSRKIHPGMPEATGKVKRSELEDSTKRSLDRECIRLNNTLKEYDKAKKVVRKGLESDERQTAKFTQRIHGLPLHLDAASIGSQVASPFSTPRSDTTSAVHGGVVRTRSAKGEAVKDKKVQPREDARENQHVDSSGPDDNVCSTDARPKPPVRQITRTQLFDNLSKPKHRSDVMTIRARLREEFDSPKPRMSRGFLARSTTCPNMATMYGRSAYSHVTLDVTAKGRPLQKPQDIRTKKSSVRSVENSESSSVTYPNGQPLTEDDIHTLLVPPKPIIVKRPEKPS